MSFRVVDLGVEMLILKRGPVIGPVAGGFLSDGPGWRWTFWVLAMAVCAQTQLRSYPQSQPYPGSDFPSTYTHTLTSTMVMTVRRSHSPINYLHARILPSSPPSTQNRSLDQRDRQHQSQIQTRRPTNAQTALPSLHHSTNENALPLTNRFFSIYLHGHHLRIPLSDLHHNLLPLRRRLRLVRRRCRSFIPRHRSRQPPRLIHIRITVG